MLVFSSQICDLYSPLLPLSPSLWLNSTPPPPPLPVWISILYIRIPCVIGGGGGYGILLETIFYRSFTHCIWPDHPKGGWGVWQINTCRKVPLQVNFFRWWHFALPSMCLIFKCQTLNKAVPLPIVCTVFCIYSTCIYSTCMCTVMNAVGWCAGGWREAWRTRTTWCPGRIMSSSTTMWVMSSRHLRQCE